MRVACVCAGIAVVASSVARAEEPPPVPVTKVELKEDPAIVPVGKVALYSGEADDKGVAFYIEGLGIANPVGIMLLSGDPAAPMKLFVKNDLSGDWDKRPKDEGGITKIRFSTEGPAMALVTSSTPERKPYRLLIWVGPEVPFHKLMAPPFVSQEEYEKRGGAPGGAGGGGGGSNTGAIVGACIAGVLLLLVIVVVAKRKKKP
jgi:hypothetical protein